MTRHDFLRRAAVLSSMSLLPKIVFAAEGMEPPSYDPAPRLAGKLRIAGTAAMSGMVQGWLNVLQRAHPMIEVALESGDPNLAGRALADGTCDIGYTGRMLWPDEINAINTSRGNPSRSYGITSGTFGDKTTTLPTGIFVHKTNPIQEISLTQLDGIFSAERRRGGVPLMTWGDLGVAGQWSPELIHAFTTKHMTGPMYDMQQTLLRGGAWAPAVRQVGEIRQDDMLIAALSNHRLSIGLAGIAYSDPALKMLPVRDDATGLAFAPTYEHVRSGRYPLIRLQYLHAVGSPSQPLKPELRELLRIVWSREGQDLAAQKGFLPLPYKILMSERVTLT
jgi:phosphate transport system substrate-binding protein